MSVAIAYKEKSRIYVGSDTLCTNDAGYSWVHKDKMWKSNEAVIVAGSGELKTLDLVRYKYPFLPEIPSKENVYDWLYNMKTLYPSEENYSFLICGNGKIFIVNANGLNIESEKYEAIGTGRDIAMGALYALESFSMPAEERVRIALKASAMFDINVGGRFNVDMI